MSQERCLMGIDIGTYSAKGVLVETDGTILSSSTVEYDLRMPRPGWAEHDADEDWWGSVRTIVPDLLEKAGRSGRDVAGVACSAIGPTMLPIDAAGRPLRTGILYGIDTRTWREVEELRERLGDDAVFERTGKRLSTQSNGPKILWFRRDDPDAFARTWKIVTATGYVGYRLTGAIAVDRYSAAAFDPLYDVASGGWSESRAEGICPVDMLPDVREATDVIGTVTREAADATGLAVGTPVVAGTIDAASEALSVGVTEPGDTMLMYGTTLFVINVTDRWRLHRSLWSSPYLVEGRSCLAAGLATSAALTRWFRDEFAGDELARERAGGENAYQVLARAAEQIPPGSNGLIALPYFSGERTPLNDPKARGVIAGLTLSHGRAHVYRSLLEGVGYALRHNLDTMAEAEADPKRLVAVGGGTQNRAWLQIVSDVLGRPQEVPETTIGASYGDAYLAGVGVGALDGFEALKATWVTPGRTIEPNAEATETYRDLYPIFRRTYENLADELHALADRQM